MATDPLILGTRGSQLAMWQAGRVKDALEAAGHHVEIKEIVTRGDREQEVPMSEVGDEAIFTKELDRALLRGVIHLAVHSLKDLPSHIPDGTQLAAVSARATPFDAFVAHPSFEGTLADLPAGATLATSSLRRRAQLKAWRSDLQIVPVRGNVDSRLEKLDASNWHGMVLAAAGLERMDLAHRIREAIDPSVMVPAVGQGALGITCHAAADATAALLRAALHDAAAGTAAAAERGFMQQIGGGCQVPTGAWARLGGDGRLVLDGCVAALDGSRLLRETRVCAPSEGEAVGRALAQHLLDAGGADILTTIRERVSS